MLKRDFDPRRPPLLLLQKKKKQKRTENNSATVRLSTFPGCRYHAAPLKDKRNQSLPVFGIVLKLGEVPSAGRKGGRGTKHSDQIIFQRSRRQICA